MTEEHLSTAIAVYNASSKEQVHDLLIGYSGSFGLYDLLALLVPTPGSGLPHPLPLLADRPTSPLPLEWSTDARLRRALSRDLPFTFAEVAGPRLPGDTAGRADAPDGLGIPIHLNRGLAGLMLYAGPTGELTEGAKIALHIVSRYGFLRLLSLQKPAAQGDDHRLTPREAEILAHAAHGLSSGEIATRTGATERTVNQHFENARRKLGTANRTETVVRALLQRQIIL